MKNKIRQLSQFIENHKTLVFIVISLLFIFKIDSIGRDIFQELHGYNGISDQIDNINQEMKVTNENLDAIKEKLASIDEKSRNQNY